MRQAAFLRKKGNHIIRRQGPPNPLQLELAGWLDRHGVFERRVTADHFPIGLARALNTNLDR